mgnify:CR=1 FL=1
MGTAVEIVAIAAVVVVMLAGVDLIRARLARPEPPEQPAAWLDRVTAERIIVHTSDGVTYDGLLRETTVDGLLLAGAKLIEQSGPTPLSGETFVPRSRVAMVQRPTSIVAAPDVEVD